MIVQQSFATSGIQVKWLFSHAGKFNCALAMSEKTTIAHVFSFVRDAISPRLKIVPRRQADSRRIFFQRKRFVSATTGGIAHDHIDSCCVPTEQEFSTKQNTTKNASFTRSGTTLSNTTSVHAQPNYATHNCHRITPNSLKIATHPSLRFRPPNDRFKYRAHTRSSHQKGSLLSGSGSTRTTLSASCPALSVLRIRLCACRSILLLSPHPSVRFSSGIMRARQGAGGGTKGWYHGRLV